MEAKKIESTYNWFFTSVLMLIGFLILGVLENGWEESVQRILTPELLTVVLFLIFFPLGTRKLHYIIFKNNVMQIKETDTFWKTTEIPISSIYEIDRYATMKLKSWGSMAVIRHKTVDGEDDWYNLWESGWSTKSLKEIFETIFKVNPDIELNHQYQDFVDGKYDEALNLNWLMRFFNGISDDPCDKDFKKIPAEK